MGVTVRCPQPNSVLTENDHFESIKHENCLCVHFNAKDKFRKCWFELSFFFNKQSSRCPTIPDCYKSSVHTQHPFILLIFHQISVVLITSLTSKVRIWGQKWNLKHKNTDESRCKSGVINYTTNLMLSLDKQKANEHGKECCSFFPRVLPCWAQFITHTASNSDLDELAMQNIS